MNIEDSSFRWSFFFTHIAVSGLLQEGIADLCGLEVVSCSTTQYFKALKEGVSPEDDLLYFKDGPGHFIGPKREAILTALEEEDGFCQKVAGCAKGFFTPAIRLMLVRDELEEIFEEDPDHPGALRIRELLLADRIGVMGALNYGLGEDTWERIQENPLRFLRGLIETVAGIALTILFPLGYLL